MSYEYSATSGRFEIPNPYRVENLAFILAGLVAGIAGIALLVAHRDAIGGASARGVKAVIVGLVLLFLALSVIARALVQLRYFFGRGRPHDLSNMDDSAGAQPAQRAQWLKENLRQNALAYREPQGAISGLVHQVFDTLIFAPRLIRAAAETQCFNLLLTVAILLGLLGSFLFYADPAVRAWIAVLLLAVLIPKLIRPLGRQENTYRRARAGIALIVVIIALPILGPPLIARIAPSLPNIAGFEFSRTLLVSLLILLVAQGLFFFSLMRQLRPRPNVNMACEQRAMSMNGNPSKLFEELERTLQSRWTETIPNRRYALVKLPENFNAQSGSFAGELLEETQPVPADAGALASIVDQLTAPATRGAVALTLLGFITFVAGVTASVRFALVPLSTQDSLATAFLAVVLFFTARYCVSSAKLLWGRVDFQSLLLWVEIEGSFEEAQINIGNQLTAAVCRQHRCRRRAGRACRCRPAGSHRPGAARAGAGTRRPSTRGDIDRLRTASRCNAGSTSLFQSRMRQAAGCRCAVLQFLWRACGRSLTPVLPVRLSRYRLRCECRQAALCAQHVRLDHIGTFGAQLLNQCHERIGRDRRAAIEALVLIATQFA